MAHHKPLILGFFLAPRRAVDVRHQDLAARVELVRKLVPSRLHRLAMPSPGREELDEGGLARLEDLWVRWRDRVNFWRCLLHGAQFRFFQGVWVMWSKGKDKGP